MPSPFPGMDPYIEVLNLWQDFHQRLASGITDALNQILLVPGRGTYYALMEVRSEVGIVEEGNRPWIVADVAVGRRARGPEMGGAVAVAEPVVEEFSPSVEIEITRSCSSPGDLVLDPFAGSGTTLVVAKKLDRRYLGFELSPQYADRIHQRLDSTQIGDRLEGGEEPKVGVGALRKRKRRSAGGEMAGSLLP